jgi:hypothetical protein
MLSRLAVLAVAAAALAGCGGGDDPAARPAAPSPEPAQAGRTSNVGCDIPAQCFPLQAEQTLARCPAAGLSPAGRRARRRLERLLVRIADIDLHNKQADEASEAVRRALAELERACLVDTTAERR